MAYRWIAARDVQKGDIIHVDAELTDHLHLPTNFRINRIEPVGEDILEIRATSTAHFFKSCVVCLHRKPTDELSVRLPEEEKGA